MLLLVMEEGDGVPVLAFPQKYYQKHPRKPLKDAPPTHLGGIYNKPLYPHTMKQK